LIVRLECALPNVNLHRQITGKYAGQYIHILLISDLICWVDFDYLVKTTLLTCAALVNNIGLCTNTINDTDIVNTTLNHDLISQNNVAEIVTQVETPKEMTTFITDDNIYEISIIEDNYTLVRSKDIDIIFSNDTHFINATQYWKKYNETKLFKKFRREIKAVNLVEVLNKYFSVDTVIISKEEGTTNSITKGSYVHPLFFLSMIKYKERELFNSVYTFLFDYYASKQIFETLDADFKKFFKQYSVFSIARSINGKICANCVSGSRSHTVFDYLDNWEKAVATLLRKDKKVPKNKINLYIINEPDIKLIRNKINKKFKDVNIYVFEPFTGKTKIVAEA
jgi:hypothetical protein